jgi:hypothetical protein
MQTDISNIIQENQTFAKDMIFILEKYRKTIPLNYTSKVNSEDCEILGTYVETVYNGSNDSILSQNDTDEDELAEQEYNKDYKLVVKENRLYTHIFKNGDEYNSINDNKSSLSVIMTIGDPILSYCSNMLECTEDCSRDALCMLNGTCLNINKDGTCTLHPILQQMSDQLGQQARQDYYTLTTTLPEVYNTCLNNTCSRNVCNISGGKKRKSKRKISKKRKSKRKISKKRKSKKNN